MDRYEFDPKTLSFSPLQPSARQKFLRFLLFSVFSLILGTAFLVLRDRHMTSPRTSQLFTEQERVIYEMRLINQDIQAYEENLLTVAWNDDRIYRVYFEQDAFPSTQREVGIGGSQEFANLGNYRYGDLLLTTGRNIDQIERKLVIQSTSFDEVIEMAATKEARLAARPAIQPVSMKDLTRFGSAFGVRFHPILKVVRPHEGIDLTAPRGTPIYATADGKVLEAGYRAGGFGRKILLDHGFGYRTLYGHCDEVLVSPGQSVKRGDVIGRVGSTGLSKSPHLHYEVHINGHPVDPVNYYATDLTGAEYDRMIEMLSMADPSFDIN